MLILYYWPGASSVVPHIVLEEVGAPYERRLVNLAQGEHKSGAYLGKRPFEELEFFPSRADATAQAKVQHVS
jgi:glutathione S-transferase